ncbi:MAG TPA: ATP-binding cassette domain-containing protein, partial [Planctomycetota bacterium]|nr:ATP-binding cassette domain-containing protein [Planctomycetota bacterium]
MIRVEALAKRYGPVRALDGVSFSIERGELVGFLGPNGAGKSTTMRLLTGYLLPDAGRVEVDGRDAASDPLGARRAQGYLPEHTPLYRGMRVDHYLDHAGRLRGLD